MQDTPTPSRSDLGSEMMQALRAGDMDGAERRLEVLREAVGLAQDHPHGLTFRTRLAIERGQVVDALCHLNSLPEDHCPELKAVCLFFMNDPMWVGLANELAEHSPHEHVRHAMTHLAEQPALA